MNKKLLKNSGFTLIETIIYIAIIGLVITSFIFFSISVSDSRNKNYVVQEVQANARVALNLISQIIRQASDANINNGSLFLTMDDENKNPTIINLNQDDGSLMIKQGVGDPIEINSNNIKVTQLIFTNLTKDSAERENIRIQMTVEYDNESSDIIFNYSQTLQTSVSLRQ